MKKPGPSKAESAYSRIYVTCTFLPCYTPLYDLHRKIHFNLFSTRLKRILHEGIHSPMRRLHKRIYSLKIAYMFFKNWYQKNMEIEYHFVLKCWWLFRENQTLKYYCWRNQHRICNIEMKRLWSNSLTNQFIVKLNKTMRAPWRICQSAL